jgi:hypothetical protein
VDSLRFGAEGLAVAIAVEEENADMQVGPILQ